jgi:hypothetical protein
VWLSSRILFIRSLEGGIRNSIDRTRKCRFLGNGNFKNKATRIIPLKSNGFSAQRQTAMGPENDSAKIE